ncbi:HAD-IC family P-type ATPase [Leptospira kanakyensis]|uniref:HAD-IC family P-type ATPase n=1 Tax=Leptospira kanakyensis TaxID=2484968 RepID=UPI00223CB500|nr:HAD-IC family P-type ATPase [Leptospira kanakyensis]MCW7482805.1 HAD-IC family P-type ATPase [Leptospira kanakyensis]
MLLEYLNVNSIQILNEAKTLEDVSHELARIDLEDPVKEELQNRIQSFPDSLFGNFGPHILIPHFRSKYIKNPELFFFLLPKGVLLGDRLIHLILFQIVPETQPSLNLRLLHGLSSLLPQILDELLVCNTKSQVLSVVERGESEMKPSYKNLNQSQIAFELQTNLSDGLSQTEAKTRLKTFGKNSIEKEKSTPILWKFFKSFFSLFAILLWVATSLCFVPGVDMPELGIAIFIVVVINGIFSFFQESKSDHAVEALRRLLAQECPVIRDGNIITIPADEIVPGDLIVLSEGDIVPADCRIIESEDVEVDNSSLTGESTSARRYKSDNEIVLEGKFLWLEMPNILFAGSSLIKGKSKAVVFGTGQSTEIGLIAKMTSKIKREESPLQKQLKQTVISISLFAFVIGVIFLFLGYLVAGLSFVQAFIFFIGIFVANVPEGLLPTVTLSLALGVSRMAKRNAILKDLSSVETLGCTTVICSDKTGTLTQNEMRVVEVYFDSENLTPKDLESKQGNQIIYSCGYYCNNASLQPNPLGDPTELALLYLAENQIKETSAKRIHTNAFESVRKRMSVVVQGDNSSYTVYAKGGPSEILSICTHVYENGSVVLLDDTRKNNLKNVSDRSASQGYRVLSFAYKGLEDLSILKDEQTTVLLESGMVYLGHCCLADPIRPKVPDAISKCHTAGIRILMITGDHPLTAESVARSIGIGGETPVVITGVTIDKMSDSALKEWIRKGEPIFARVSPSQKLRIVSILQELGEIVAVTGDGVNDGPALKKADIGIAMGKRGTEVAKEAARMIIVDDDFATIVDAIEEGRGVFDNIRKFSAYVLNSNPQELIPFLLWALIPGFPLLMTVMGVLAVDVGTDLIPAMGLGAEPPEKGIMLKAPRHRNEKLISIGFILRSYFVEGMILFFSCLATYFYFVYTECHGILPSSPPGLNMAEANVSYLQSLTAFFFPTITVQIANVLSKRSRTESIFQMNLFTNKIIWLGIGFSFLLCGIFFYTDLSSVYYFAPVPPHVYLFAFHGTVVMILYSEVIKYFRRKKISK